MFQQQREMRLKTMSKDIIGPTLETKTVLIVDDEPDNLRLFSSVLSQEHYSIMTASDGAECLKIAQDETLDLILLDVNMPEMDGFETIKHLRSIKKHRYTPIVFLTGYGTTPVSIDVGYVLGGNEYWTKPISSEELIVRVRAVIRTADAEKKLRKLQQSFYSMVVHDLRNPMGAILGLSELLLDEKGSLTANQMEIVTEISTASVALLKSAKDLLELSQFESGEYMIRREPVQLTDLVQAAVAATQVKRNQKQITIDVKIEESLALWVDEEYFREVLDNLFDNAVRYTPANGKIQFRAKRRPAVDSHTKELIAMEIIDSGSGISLEAIPTLFDKNRITDMKLRKKNSRTGLGLVICQEIIAAHDGTISIESAVGEGTKVSILLPARQG
jgi:two-component system, sensor histidine kinase and response regulator